MPNPRKRKGGKQIGRTLDAAGVSESTFTTAEIDQILELSRYGHDGDGAFAQGALVPSGSNVGSGVPIGKRVLQEDVAIKVSTIVALSSSAIFDSGSNPAASASHDAGVFYHGKLWADAVKRYYVTDDTTKVGMSISNPATDQYGIAHSPNGPDSVFFGKLLNIGNQEFWINPASWEAGHELKIVAACDVPDITIKLVQGDSGAQVGASIAGQHAPLIHNRTINRHGDNDTNGIKVEISGSSLTGSTGEGEDGYIIAWAVQDQ